MVIGEWNMAMGLRTTVAGQGTTVMQHGTTMMREQGIVIGQCDWGSGVL